MNEDIRIDKLDDEGKHLFVYSDKYNIHFVFYSKARKSLYAIKTDKFLNILSIDEIKTPGDRDFSQFTNIRFFKPYTKDDDHYFIGIVEFGEESFKFTIKYNVLQYEEKAQYQPSGTFNALECLQNTEVVSYIQKRNRLYVVGYEDGDLEKNPMYGIIDLEKDKFENIYYLFSDVGDITLNTINIDTDDLKVYVAGSLKQTDSGREVPYIEAFLLRSHP